VNPRHFFSEKAQELEIEGSVWEIIQQHAFMQALEELGVTELAEVDVACLMQVLARPQYGHAIILEELLSFLQSYGVKVDEAEEDKEVVRTKKKNTSTKKQQIKEVMKDERVRAFAEELCRKTQRSFNILKAELQKKVFE